MLFEDGFLLTIGNRRLMLDVMKHLRAVILSGLFIALEIVFSRLLSVAPNNLMRLSLGFLPVAVAGATLGPLWGGAVGAVADALGAALVARAPFHPGITLCALLAGATYGLFLHRKPIKAPRVFLSALTVNAVFEVGLKAFWLSGLFRMPYLAALPYRLAQAAVMLPAQTACICLTWRYLGGYIEKRGILKAYDTKAV
jgi:ECF transporter S component (folate family)